MQISQSGRELFQFKIWREWEGHGATCPFTHGQAWNQGVIIGSSLRPAQLEISTRMVILIRTHTKKYTKGDG